MRFLQKMLLASALLVMLAGCRVDPVYDLDHLDPEITVMKTGLMLPLSWSSKMRLDLSTGMGFNRLGESFGFALNLHHTAVNFVLGCDYVPFHCVDASLLFKGIPAKYAILPRGHMNLNLYVGLNIAFGQNRLDHAKRFISE